MKRLIDYLTMKETEIVADIEQHARKKDYATIYLPDVALLILSKPADNLPLFVAHLDTVSKIYPKRQELKIVGNTIYLHKSARKVVSCLGGDDRCGCWIIYNLIDKQVRANFALFFDEEAGCAGSRKFCKQYKELLPRPTAIVGLDRRGSNDCALYGSDNDDLIEIFLPDYQPTFGSISDCAILADEYDVACVNLSVGFNMEHSRDEFIVITQTKKTLDFLLREDVLNRLSKQVYEPFYLHLETPYGVGRDYCDFCGDFTIVDDVFGSFICRRCWNKALDYLWEADDDYPYYS